MAEVTKTEIDAALKIMRDLARDPAKLADYKKKIYFL